MESTHLDLGEPWTSFSPSPTREWDAWSRGLAAGGCRREGAGFVAAGRWHCALSQTPEVALCLVTNPRSQRRDGAGAGHWLPAPWLCSISRLLQPFYGLCCAGLTQPPCSGGGAAGVPLQALPPCVPSASAQARLELHLLPLQPKRSPCSRSCRGLSPCSAEDRCLLCRGVLQPPRTTPALRSAGALHA